MKKYNMGKYAMYQVSEDNVRKYGKLGTALLSYYLVFLFLFYFFSCP